MTVAGSSSRLPAARFGMIASFDHKYALQLSRRVGKPRMRHATCSSAITWLLEETSLRLVEALYVQVLVCGAIDQYATWRSCGLGQRLLKAREK